MMKRACHAVGIDLGTTYSSLAYLDAQRMPRVVQDSSGRAVLPSVVFFDDSEVVVGEIAQEQALTRADRVVQFIKVHMGDEWRREINGRVHTPESISAIILAHLVREAEAQIGPISQAVITVPAYFTEKRRRATQQAGEIAGLNVIGTLNEPMSAALAYGLHQEQKEQTALVYDLGGGTFDVTIVRVSPTELVELATLGNRQLGGKDWDEALVNYVADDFQTKHGEDPRTHLDARQELIIECERAKRRLSQLRKAAIKMHAFGKEHLCEVTREEFERLTTPLLQTTRLTTEMALEDARLGWNDIDRVVLVGGSGHMPMVREMLEQLSGKRPDAGVNPVLAVALGAAQYAYLLETNQAPRAVRSKGDHEPHAPAAAAVADDQEQPTLQLPSLRFVTAHGVGVRARVKGQDANVVLIRKNTPVPCRVSQSFTTFANNKDGLVSRLAVAITQGDTTDLALAETLGVGQISGFPKGEKAGQPVSVTMEFDEQGRLHVHAVYVRTGADLQIDLEVPGGLTEAKVDEYRRLLEANGLARSDETRPSQETSRKPSTATIPPLQQFEELDALDDDDDLPLLEPV
jgi:molecular chaperone DnaK